MNTAPPNLSVTDPLSPAFARVKTVLFQPFDLGRWLTIAFCAWLSILGESSSSGGANWQARGDHGDLQQQFTEAKNWVMDNLHWLVPWVVVGVIVLTVLWLVFLWLNCRGQFMFLHCVAENRAEVVVPWRRYAARGNHLFLFRLIVGVVSGLTLLAPLIVAGVLGFGLFTAGAGGLAVAGFVLALLCVIVIALGWVIVNKFTRDFVVPVMARSTTSAFEAWRLVFALLRPHLGVIVLYLLMQLVIQIAIVALLLAFCAITCCVAGCLMALPYVGAAIILPVLVFERAYPLYFLRQFGANLDFLDQPLQPDYGTATLA